MYNYPRISGFRRQPFFQWKFNRELIVMLQSIILASIAFGGSLGVCAGKPIIHVRTKRL